LPDKKSKITLFKVADAKTEGYAEKVKVELARRILLRDFNIYLDSQITDAEIIRKLNQEAGL
jgi:hypothetical protein